MRATYHANGNNNTRCSDKLKVGNDGSCNKDIVEDAVYSKIFGDHITACEKFVRKK